MRYYLVAIILSVCAFSLNAQIDCSDDRYSEPIYEVEVNSGIEFGGSAQPSEPDNIVPLLMDVYSPVEAEGDDIEARPLIIMAFGGAFILGARTSPDIVEICNRFAARGYVAVSIDYRLTNELVTNPSEELGTYAVLKGVHDMKAAVRYFHKEAGTYRIDPSHIYVGGVSAGAFLALHTAYMDELGEIPELIIDELEAEGGVEGNSGNPDYPSDVAGVINLCGALGDADWIQVDDLPIVSVHGTDDGVVPYGTDTLTTLDINMLVDGSASIHERTEELNLTSAFYSFEGAGHTPFILGGGSDITSAYMDTTFNFVNDFLYDRVCDITNIESINSSGPQIHFYPNPVKEELNVSLPIDLKGDFYYRLMNINGAIIQAGSFGQTRSVNIERSNQTNGYYLFEIYSNNMSIIKKILFE